MPFDVIGIAGSLRKASYNRTLLAAAVELAPPGLAIEPASIAGIPLFDGDVEAAGIPASVLALKERVRRADGLLLVTPEYNYSVPGVLKNAIDWLSRKPDQPFAGKPAAIMGASNGRFGTVRSQQHLRAVAAAVGLIVLPTPEVMVSNAGETIDAAGRLTDEVTRAAVTKLLVAFEAWIARWHAGAQGASATGSRAGRE
ncbi:MAG TPA: NAD(P)H-dependent oxidoreductase [Candidatus Acidoferrales bacterium]|nr:NAD(P)H-dependent oxidoreductase [Candidatus Acidoferrales bacterium]